MYRIQDFTNWPESSHSFFTAVITVIRKNKTVAFGHVCSSGLSSLVPKLGNAKSPNTPERGGRTNESNRDKNRTQTVFHNA